MQSGTGVEGAMGSEKPQGATGAALEPLSAASRRVLVVDDEEVICKYLQRALREHGCDAVYRLTGQAALQELERQRYSILVADIRLPDMDGIELLRQAKERSPQTSAVMITAHGSLESAIEAMRLGASDYVPKPFKPEEFCLVIDRVLDRRRLLDELAELRRELADKYQFENIISQTPRMRDVFATIGRVAATDTTVLITGETGTGKELVARAIHYNSPRRNKSFMAINCGAFPETLLESELFGHEQGAFTGAIATKPGIFEVADGGTLLLDEIGNISHAMQVKLLRVIETMEFKRVGGVETHTCDVRILAATHADLAAAVGEGTFRRDLFYRINVVPIVLPPLRERVADIPLLVEHFIRRHGPKLNPAVQDISRSAMRKLLRHPWPGNIRQLEHVVQRALILADGDTLLAEHLPIEGAQEPDDHGDLAFNEHLPLDRVRNGLVEQLERAYLDRVLRLHRGSIRKTARHAGLSERSIYEKLKKYHLDRRTYKAAATGAPA
ncbi:MAG: sigma-54-dependent Fis family transcriptional regulator [Planctomycetes bacterium]|nr:sigma-54-dependent Fis family transcriptional regulator [Planctomycetota bacterium]